MKKISIFVVFGIIILISIYGAGFIFVNAKGKDLLISAIQDNFNIQATIKECSLEFPLTLKVKEFQCEDLSFNKGRAALGLFNPFTYHLNLRAVYLEGLQLKIINNEKGVHLPPFTVNNNLKNISTSIANSNNNFNQEQEALLPNDSLGTDVAKNISITINNFYLQNSSIKVTNENRRFMQIVLGDISLHVKDFTYPGLSMFKLKGSLSLLSTFESEKVAGKISLSGWINYQKKNMDLNLKIDNFDYSEFSSYYPLHWRADYVGIKEALFSLSSNLTSEDNDLTIDSTLSLDKIEFMRKEEAGDDVYSKARNIKTIIAFFSNQEGKPSINFKIKTKMDAPNLDLSSLKGKISGALDINPFVVIKELVGGTKGKVIQDVDKTEELTIGTMIDTFKSIGDSFSDIFKNKEESSSE